MDAKLKELKDSFQQAQQAFTDGREKLSKMTAKANKLESDIPNLLRVAEKMEAAKNAAISSFAADEISQLELDEARDVFEKARKAHVEAEEVLAAVRKNIKQIEGDNPKLSNALVSAKTKLWRYIMEDLKAKICEQVGDEIVRGWAAATMCGAEHFSYFVASIFNCPPPDAVKAIRLEVEKEYLV